MTFEPRDLRRIPAIHPHWTGHLLLSQADGRLRHEETGATGRYAEAGDRLDVFWDRYPQERFFLHDGVLLREGVAVPDLSFAPFVRVRDRPFRLSRFCIGLPGLGHEVELRSATSDIPTFDQVFLEREYETDSLPETARTILDLGGNIGLAALFFGLRYPEARLFSVEPHPDNAAMLRRNTAALGARMTALQGAVWHRDGMLDLRTTDDDGMDLGAWGVQVAEAAGGPEGSSAGLVPAFRVDTLMQRAGFDRVDLLKIDVEGAELELFTDPDRGWLDRVGFVILETHDRFRPGSDAAVTAALEPGFVELPSKGENRFFAARG
ncbi:FkbM family methyltransferase [Ensifer soli]|uniref:FkbM family methyltransferase n=1 Tax=Ciceribacter sp. sgz301302 TaxID=3342379 RepID=UPI0035B95EBB